MWFVHNMCKTGYGWRSLINIWLTSGWFVWQTFVVWFVNQEAQQREERLHDKLEELQGIIKMLEVDCQETLTNHFEETRLLSRIENLEKQAKLLSKIRPGSMEKAEIEIQQLLQNVEKVQSASREIQERLHKKLLQREQELADAER